MKYTYDMLHISLDKISSPLTSYNRFWNSRPPRYQRNIVVLYMQQPKIVFINISPLSKLLKYTCTRNASYILSNIWNISNIGNIWVNVRDF
jgi:hypothetical protein